MSARKHFRPRLNLGDSQGFMLLEVLVAMSLILGVWIVSVGAYQRLAFNLAQQESKRSQLRKELDAFETHELARANLHLSHQGLSHDTNRVSGWHRSLRPVAQSTLKDQR